MANCQVDGAIVRVARDMRLWSVVEGRAECEHDYDGATRITRS